MLKKMILKKNLKNFKPYVIQLFPKYINNKEDKEKQMIQKNSKKIYEKNYFFVVLLYIKYIKLIYKNKINHNIYLYFLFYYKNKIITIKS